MFVGKVVNKINRRQHPTSAKSYKTFLLKTQQPQNPLRSREKYISSGCTPDLLNPNLQFNKIPSLSARALKFQKHCSNIFTFNSQLTSVYGITLAGGVFEILESIRV